MIATFSIHISSNNKKIVATKKFPSFIDIFAIIIYEYYGQSQEYKQFAITPLMHKLRLIIVTFMNGSNFF
jgi:hypothetical protein